MEIFETQPDKALSKLIWLWIWHCIKEEVGLDVLSSRCPLPNLLFFFCVSIQRMQAI